MSDKEFEQLAFLKYDLLKALEEWSGCQRCAEKDRRIAFLEDCHAVMERLRDVLYEQHATVVKAKDAQIAVLRDALTLSQCDELTFGTLCKPCRDGGVGCLRYWALHSQSDVEP